MLCPNTLSNKTGVGMALQKNFEDIKVNEDADIWNVILLLEWLKKHFERKVKVLTKASDSVEGKAKEVERTQYGFSWEQFSEHLGESKSVIEKFMTGNPLRDCPTGTRLLDQKVKFAKRARPLLDQQRPLPERIQQEMVAVYPDFSPLRAGPIKSAEVLRHQAIFPEGRLTVDNLSGLNAVVRVSTEGVTDPGQNMLNSPDSLSMKEVRVVGFSISILNVIPREVQCGINHSLFKMHQRGIVNKVVSSIEGVVVPQNRSVYFSGFSTFNKNPFFGWVSPDELIESYGISDEVHLHGAMMGLSANGYNFCGVFEMFPIFPMRSELLNDDRRNEFSELYKKVVLMAGVRNLDDTVECLLDMGVSASDPEKKLSPKNYLAQTIMYMVETRSDKRRLYLA